MGSIRINFREDVGRGQDEEYYEDVTDAVTDTLIEICGKDCSVDWRDWREVEIHNVENVTEVAARIKDCLKSNIYWMLWSAEDISSIRGTHPVD